MSKFGLYFIVLFFSVFSIGQTYEKTEELYTQAELELEKNELEKAAFLYEAAALNELQLEAARIEDSYQILSIASYLFFKTEHFERALDNRVTKSFQISWSKLSAYEFVESSR